MAGSGFNAKVSVDGDLAQARPSFFAEIRTWPTRRWYTTVVVSLATILVTAIPTAMIPNPIFGRDIPVTWWAWPVLVVTSLLAGAVAATYVARRDGDEETRGSRLGLLGAITTFFAVGCPVCNKLVLIALGYSGALQYFAPAQPLLAAAAVVILAWALIARVTRERQCPIPQRA